MHWVNFDGLYEFYTGRLNSVKENEMARSKRRPRLDIDGCYNCMLICRTTVLATVDDPFDWHQGTRGNTILRLMHQNAIRSSYCVMLTER